jgi:hypothetical protein
MAAQEAAPLLSVADVATILQMSRVKVYDLMNRNGLPLEPDQRSTQRSTGRAANLARAAAPMMRQDRVNQRPHVIVRMGPIF